MVFTFCNAGVDVLLIIDSFHENPPNRTYVLVLGLSLHYNEKKFKGGKEHMTSVFEEKNISKAIMRVGLPSMLGQLTTLIYNIADTFFVSLTKEPATIAAVTLCAPILLIIMSIACIFGMGGSSVIARLLGEGKKEEAGETMNFCVYAMAGAGVMTLILGLLFLQPLAKISGADAENMAYTCDYLKWIFIGAPCRQYNIRRRIKIPGMLQERLLPSPIPKLL